MISQAQFKSTVEQAGASPSEVEKLVEDYNESQIAALKQALLLASAFVLVGLWFARALPGEALARKDEEVAAAGALTTNEVTA